MEKEIEIEDYDIEIIMMEQYEHLNIILENSYCTTCKKTSTITNYKSYLNNLNDIILRGFCLKCGGPVNRYIETGENLQSAEVAVHIKNVLQISRKKKK
ncbi:hypothetical protein [Pedobacter jeongneungensis]|uniref:hypothetical protein n=1 Tax=Pedobacter jeongneungensis TaxID=947309 RepID=UPI00046A05EA|nr:hypothetical protein [Pedobacter jeongneungensis]